jgi:hypothetical protein
MKGEDISCYPLLAEPESAYNGQCKITGELSHVEANALFDFYKDGISSRYPSDVHFYPALANLVSATRYVCAAPDALQPA